MRERPQVAKQDESRPGGRSHGQDPMPSFFAPLELVARIKEWGKELGFQSIGIAGVDLGEAEARLQRWLDSGFHGEMDYMARHGTKRSRPQELVPGTQAVITVRLNYHLGDLDQDRANLADPARAYISRYALGRDYHKLLRHRLQALAERIEREIGPFAYRAFTDSAPVMETELGARSGNGWRGKHTLLLNREGSLAFLGELYVDLPLPPDEPEHSHCGNCTACLSACPTGAIVAPYVLDARRCISYLTIELAGPIPPELRPLIGNRVYGCDDCQLACPWNRFARPSAEADFQPRHGLDAASLAGLFAWDEKTFEEKLAGSPIRRIGHERWLRNLAVGLGNGPSTPESVAALRARLDHASGLVREHVEWALERLATR